jgi:membrane associated rhomboid family serine protease
VPDLSRLDVLLGGELSITYLLIAVCVAVSLVGFWALDRKRYRKYFVFVPSKAAPSRSWVGTVLSHFAHGDAGHLLVNLLALFIFGPRVERALGPSSYLLLYLVSGAFGTFFVWLFRRKNPRHAALGASGCIAGVVFASVVIAPTSRIFLLVFPVPVPAPVFAVVYLAISSLSMGQRDGVAHEAHIGGALAGFALAGLLFERGFEPLIRTATQLVS